MCARLIPIVAFAWLAVPVMAQEQARTDTVSGEYALVAYVGGGLSMYSHKPETPAFLDASTSTLGLCGSLRVMWHPDHLLRLGIETGRTRFYGYTFSDGTEQGEVDLTAVPLLLVWSMPLHERVNVFLGYGYYRLTSHLDYITETESSVWSLGWMAAASYVHPLTEDLGLCGELKWMNAVESRNTVFSTQVQLQWHFLRW